MECHIFCEASTEEVSPKPEGVNIEDIDKVSPGEKQTNLNTLGKEWGSTV